MVCEDPMWARQGPVTLAYLCMLTDSRDTHARVYLTFANNQVQIRCQLKGWNGKIM